MINLLIPGIVCFIVIHGIANGVDVFSVFTQGVQNGIQVLIKIFPTLIGLVTAVYMVRASGGIDILTNFCSPLMDFLGIPPECTQLMILKPISGGGGLAVGSELIKTHGVDSYIGRVSAIMLASSETSFYTMSIYFGAIKQNKMSYVLICAIVADFVAFLVSSHVALIF